MEVGKQQIIVSLVYFSAANWLKPPGHQHKHSASVLIPHWLTWRYIRNNLTWVIWVILFFTVNIVLFVEAAVRYRDAVRNHRNI